MLLPNLDEPAGLDSYLGQHELSGILRRNGLDGNRESEDFLWAFGTLSWMRLKYFSMTGLPGRVRDKIEKLYGSEYAISN